MAIPTPSHARFVNTAIVLWMIVHVNAVSWFIKTRPVDYGKSVELFCNTPEICNDCNKQWHRESDRRLLTFDGAPTNPSKYTSIIYPNGFSLIIKNFSSNDANETFICTNGFKSYRKQLNTDENFEYNSPDNGTNHADKKNTALHMTMEFNDVNPTFNCSIFSMDGTSIKSIKRNITSKLLSVHVSLTSKANESNWSCKEHVHMRCFIESIELDVIMEDKRHFCVNEKRTEWWTGSRKSMAWLISIIVFLACVLIGLIWKYICLKRYKHFRFRKKQKRFQENKMKPEEIIGMCDITTEQEHMVINTS